ncbi:MAG TPA: hypothetical protein VGR21_11130, partial [Cryptosporangiaceae bacterium]|nr:hypothetical protein [Cryptosporangiaceae bacterium]
PAPLVFKRPEKDATAEPTFLGWRSDTELVFHEPGVADSTITVRSVRGGPRTVLTTIPGPFEVECIDAAGALLRRVDSRQAHEPAYGSRPTSYWVLLLAVGGGAAGSVALAARTWQRARSRHRRQAGYLG